MNNEIGCPIGNIKINHILYADDLILIGPSVKSLQQQIETCLSYFENHYLSVNADKTKVMVVKPKNYIDYGDPELYIGTSKLEVVSKIKYLGMCITKDLKDDDHITSLYRAQCMRGNLLTRNFHMCDENIKIHLFKSFCTSLYGIPLALESKKETLNKLRVCYNNSLRFLMNINGFCSITEQFVKLGIPTFQELLRKNTAGLFLRIKKSSNKLLAAIFTCSFFRVSKTYAHWCSYIF